MLIISSVESFHVNCLFYISINY